MSLNNVIKATNISITSLTDFKKRFGTGITLTKNETNDIIKVIKSLESRGNVLKEATRSIISTINEKWPHTISKSVFISLRLTTTTLAIDAAIQKKIYRSGTTALIISNKETENIMKIVQALKESASLVEGISETIKMEAKEEKEGFREMFLGTLATSVLRNMLPGREVISADEGKIRASQKF